ncbi:hypothetical protein [Aquiflexum sp.]|uniref:hypothetical protein n=1 Tax=Aquiflexum sp. TaxID=1872584 RepID=UPI003594064F
MNIFNYKFISYLCIPGALLFIGCANVTTNTHVYKAKQEKIVDAIEVVGSKIQAKKEIEIDSIPTYRKWEGNQMNFLYRMHPVSISSDSTQMKVTTVGLFKIGNQNLNVALTSFVNQELGVTDPDKNPSDFYLPSTKSKKEMWKRNMISIGYANYYSKKNNPFLNQKDLKVGAMFLGILEGLHLFPVIAGSFIGEGREDRIAIPIIGIVGIVAWKFLVPLMENLEAIEDHNELVNSGYKYPIEIDNQKGSFHSRNQNKSKTN